MPVPVLFSRIIPKLTFSVAYSWRWTFLFKNSLLFTGPFYLAENTCHPTPLSQSFSETLLADFKVSSPPFLTVLKREMVMCDQAQIY